MIDSAVVAAVHDQSSAGLDVISDGEQTRLDFNLSFYGYLEGIDLESAPPRRFGPPAHDQRGKHKISWPFEAPNGLGTVDDFMRLQRLYDGNATSRPVFLAHTLSPVVYCPTDATPTAGRSPRS